VNKVPDGPVVHLQPAFRKLSHQSAQGEVPLLYPMYQSNPVFVRNRFWPVAADFNRRDASVSRRRRIQLIAVLPELASFPASAW
jgi:hypothetical protein